MFMALKRQLQGQGLLPASPVIAPQVPLAAQPAIPAVAVAAQNPPIPPPNPFLAATDAAPIPSSSAPAARRRRTQVIIPDDDEEGESEEEEAPAKRAKKSRKRARKEYESDSSDTGSNSSDSPKRRASESRLHVVKVAGDNLKNARKSAPRVTQADYHLFGEVVSIDGDTNRTIGRRKSSLFNLMGAKENPDPKSGKASVTLPNADTDRISLAKLSRIASDSHTSVALHSKLSRRDQAFSREYATHIQTSCHALQAVYEANPHDVHTLFDEAVNLGAKRTMTNEQLSPIDFDRALIFVLARHVAALEAAKPPPQRLTTAAAHSAQPGATSSNSANFKLYTLPPLYITPQGKVLCYPCVHKALAEGRMSWQGQPLDTVFHPVDANGRSKGNCPLSTADRQKFGRA
jgi:hypothetical protein